MMRKVITIPPDSSGMRLDRYIRALFPHLSESVIRQLFSRKDIKLEGRSASRDTILAAGQVLQVYLPDSALVLQVVYEDDDVLLVNKPSGISVEPDPRGGPDLSGLCRLHVSATGDALFSPAACHRLDVKTSGLCLFAKNPRALEILQAVFRNRTLEKHYICLVRGIMKPPEAICKAFLVKDAEKARVRITDHPVPGGRKIITEYQTLESGPVSRLDVHLVTGRTHQIRAHLAALGHPVLGDDIYGDRSFNRLYKARSLKLCAVSLKLDTAGAIPALDHHRFTITPPF